MKKRQSSRARLAACERVIGYYFSKPSLLEAALTHSSLRAPDRECNERLEFLGDSVLGLVITEELYRLLPDQSEGELTRIKSAVVSRSALHTTSTRLGLARFAEFARGVGRRDALPASVVANLVESIIGAIYLDAGYYPAREFVLRHLGDELDKELSDRGAKNHKSLLQHEVQQAISVTPTYRTVEEEGPDHRKDFTVAALIRGREWGRATGGTKKEAEQEAARLALEAWERRGRSRRRRRTEAPAGESPAVDAPDAQADDARPGAPAKGGARKRRVRKRRRKPRQPELDTEPARDQEPEKAPQPRAAKPVPEAPRAGKAAPEDAAAPAASSPDDASGLAAGLEIEDLLRDRVPRRRTKRQGGTPRPAPRVAPALDTPESVAAKPPPAPGKPDTPGEPPAPPSKPSAPSGDAPPTAMPPASAPETTPEPTPEPDFDADAFGAGILDAGTSPRRPKRAGRRVPTPQAPTPKTDAKKATTPKAAAKKRTKKAAAKKAPAKKAPAKRSPTKKSVAKKRPAKRSAAKKAAPKRTAAKKTVRKRVKRVAPTTAKRSARKDAPAKAAKKRVVKKKAAKKRAAKKKGAKKKAARRARPRDDDFAAGLM